MENNEKYLEIIKDLDLTKEQKQGLIGTIQSIAESLLDKRFMLETKENEK